MELPACPIERSAHQPRLARWRYYFRRVRETFAEEGVIPLVWRMVVKCASPLGVLGVANFYRLDLTRPLPQVCSQIMLRIEEATLADLEALTELRVHDLRASGAALAPQVEQGLREQSLERFARGWKCYVARVNDRIIHCTWVAKSWAESIGRRFIVLRENEAYTADAYTARAWRSKGIYRAVTWRILKDLKETKHTACYVIVHVECRPSKFVQRLLGYKTLGTVLYFAPRRLATTWVLPLQGTSAPFLEAKRT